MGHPAAADSLQEGALVRVRRRVERDDMLVSRREPRVAIERPPRAQRKASETAGKAVAAALDVGAYDENRIARSHERRDRPRHATAPAIEQLTLPGGRGGGGRPRLEREIELGQNTRAIFLALP